MTKLGSGEEILCKKNINYSKLYYYLIYANIIVDFIVREYCFFFLLQKVRVWNKSMWGPSNGGW